MSRMAMGVVLLLAFPATTRGAAGAGEAAWQPEERQFTLVRSDTTAPPDAQGQSPAPATSAEPEMSPNSLKTLFRDLGSDFKHLPSTDSAVVASIGGGMALAVHPLDDDINARLRGTGGFFRAGHLAGNTLTLMGGATAAYVLGRMFGSEKAAHVGLDLLRAQLMSEAIVQSLKIAVRRPRPDSSSGYSFPSGHAALTFATAAVLDRHHSWRIALPAYALATYVATSRLHDNVHNLSDVVFGAALGTLAGRTVTRHVVRHFAIVPQVARGGAAIMFVRTTQDE